METCEDMRRYVETCGDILMKKKYYAPGYLLKFATQNERRERKDDFFE